MSNPFEPNVSMLEARAQVAERQVEKWVKVADKADAELTEARALIRDLVEAGRSLASEAAVASVEPIPAELAFATARMHRALTRAQQAGYAIGDIPDMSENGDR